ncbi:MAG: Crp/Fnr family transcriptional regulator [Sneathiellaceae bacterium]
MAHRLDSSLIKGMHLFREMADDSMERMLQAALPRRLDSGGIVFVQGEEARHFFVLLDGRLKVTQSNPAGEQIVVRHVVPGELFGIARAIRRPDYPGTAAAVAESLVLAWPSARWDDFVAESPVLAINALQTVGQRLQEAHGRIRELSTEEVERRVAHAVLRLMSQAGRKTDEGIAIDIPLTRRDIAEMSGTTLHTVSRLLSSWQERGLVGGGRKRVVVADPHGLFMLAEGKG